MPSTWIFIAPSSAILTLFPLLRRAITEMVPNLIRAPDFWSPRNMGPKKFGPHMKIITWPKLLGAQMRSGTISVTALRWRYFLSSWQSLVGRPQNSLLLTTVHTVKSKVEISKNFVAFSEYMTFKIEELQFSITYKVHFTKDSLIWFFSRFPCWFVKFIFSPKPSIRYFFYFGTPWLELHSFA